MGSERLAVKNFVQVSIGKAYLFIHPFIHSFGELNTYSTRPSMFQVLGERKSQDSYSVITSRAGDCWQINELEN